MSKEDTTELDKIIIGVSHTGYNRHVLEVDPKDKGYDRYQYYLSNKKAREALLLWRDTEVIKELETLYTNGMMNKMGDAYYLKLQSNLKEKE